MDADYYWKPFIEDFDKSSDNEKENTTNMGSVHPANIMILFLLSIPLAACFGCFVRWRQRKHVQNTYSEDSVHLRTRRSQPHIIYRYISHPLSRMRAPEIRYPQETSAPPLLNPARDSQAHDSSSSVISAQTNDGPGSESSRTGLPVASKTQEQV